MEDLTDAQQEILCKICSYHLYDCSVNTGPHNLCEGSRCEEAMDYYLDEINEEKAESRRYLLISLN